MASLPLKIKTDSLLIYVVCTALAVAVGVLYPRWRRYKRIRAFKHQHGCKDAARYPHEDPIMGSDMTRARLKAMQEGRFFRLYTEQFQKYGKTFEEIWRGKPLINTTEPANLQRIAAVGFDDFGKDPDRSVASAPFFGPSIFSDGPIWKHARSMIKPIFTRAELSDIDHLASFANRFMALLPDDGSMVDVQPLLRRLFLDVAMDFLFGRPLGFLEPEVPAEATEFHEAFLKAQNLSIQTRESGWLKFNLSRYTQSKEYKDAYTTVHRYVDREVARALQETKADKQASEDSPAVRRRYVLLDEMAKETRDPVQLRYHVLAVFLPARDSTGIAVSNMLFQLARHPHEWAKLRRVALAIGDAPLTFEKLKSLVEFRYVFHETVRTIGPAARVWRMAVKDTILPVGGGPDQKSPVFVARGTPVVSGTWAMMHDPDLWGDDVEEFKPDRWIGRKPLWDFVPFWGGPRICPAQQQVLTHLVYLMVRLTQRFERLENCDPVLKYVEKITPSIESKNGVKVAFKN